ncbi:ABC transporter substrate-binding protein [Breznakiellaceae bacterium SP9]
MNKGVTFFVVLWAAVASLMMDCSREEYDLEQIESGGVQGVNEILAKTVSKPWRGQEFVPGKQGGTWNEVMSTEPKSFNLLLSERDSPTAAVVGAMHDYLVDYDTSKRDWEPRIVSFEIQVDEAADTLTVLYTLRDDLYWSYYDKPEKIPVTSDDVVFWYNEICGDKQFNSSSYNGQFLVMSDGTEAHIDIEKIDDKRFAFHFPRIVAEPLLSSNMHFGPRFIYEKAKQEKGVQGVLDLFSVAIDPKEIPSMGEWFLVEYVPSQRLRYRRNPNYWKRDSAGQSIPYIEERIVQIVPNESTKLLLFKEGKLDDYVLRPEDVDELVGKPNSDYTVFNSEGSLTAPFWTFNQNPKQRSPAKYGWFTQKEFRQAMSCLLNRQRIIDQVYRGLAAEKLDFFPEPNPFYNERLLSPYVYDPQRALSLLASIGIKPDTQGIMRDGDGKRIDFDLTIRSDSSINTDIASIIRDELSKVGIKVNIRVLDFQKLVDLLKTFEWDTMLIGLSGSQIFPTQGSNVWPSDGNLHMWYPNQETPATEWEARVDYLYNEGAYTSDKVKAQRIWDEFQSIIIEQVPVVNLLRPRGFWALWNRWDFSNVYYDNVRGAETQHVFIK